MRFCILFIFSILTCLSVAGQDSLKQSRRSGPEIWIDYGKLALYATDFESKLEAGINWRIGRIAPVVHAGYSELMPKQAIKNGNYTVTGWYVRPGVEYYFPLDNRNRLILGGRYGYSEYDEVGSYLITSDLWPDESGTFERLGLTASWAELAIGSEMTLGQASRFAMGGYFSLRVLIDRDEFDTIDTYAIPGYGRTIDKTVPALQLYIKFSVVK